MLDFRGDAQQQPFALQTHLQRFFSAHGGRQLWQKREIGVEFGRVQPDVALAGILPGHPQHPVQKRRAPCEDDFPQPDRPVTIVPVFLQGGKGIQGFEGVGMLRPQSFFIEHERPFQQRRRLIETFPLAVKGAKVVGGAERVHVFRAKGVRALFKGLTEQGFGFFHSFLAAKDAGKGVHRLQGVLVLFAQRADPRLKNTPQVRLSLGVFFLQHVQEGEVVDEGDGIGVFLSIDLGVKIHSAVVQGFGLVESALAFMEQGEVVDGRQHRGVAVAQHFASPVHGKAQIRFGLIIQAFFFQDFAKVVGGDHRCRVVFSQDPAQPVMNVGEGPFGLRQATLLTVDRGEQA